MVQLSMGTTLLKGRMATSTNIVFEGENTSQHLVNPENVFLIPLHIKFGVMENSVKAVVQNNSVLEILKEQQD
jgi:hypothetical protein